MKNCPICQREFPDYVQYCTRDGTRLKPSGPLSQLANFEVKQCYLCKKYYPAALDMCPVHGIALNLSPLPEADQQDIEPPPALAAEAAGSDESEIVNEEVESVDLRPAADTKELIELAAAREADAPAPPSGPLPSAALPSQPASPSIAFKALTQYSISTPASSDRRLVGVLVIIVLATIGGLAAVTLPNIFPKGAKKGPPVAATPQAEPVAVQPEQVAETEKTEIVQRIELLSIKEKPTAGRTAVSAPATPAAKSALPVPSRPVPAVASVAAKKAPAETQPVAPTGKKSLPVIKESKNSKEIKEAKENKEAKESKTDDELVAENRRVREIPTVNAPKATVTAAEPANPEVHRPVAVPRIRSDRSAKVVTAITNRSRQQTLGGYVYEFDLVLREVNGVAVKWKCTTARKVSFSGRTADINGVYMEQLSPKGTARYRMVVRMTGSCIEDWYGEIIYSSSGVDENGNPIELRQTLLLDNSFPSY